MRYDHIRALMHFVPVQDKRFFVCRHCEGAGHVYIRDAQVHCYACKGIGYDPELIKGFVFYSTRRYTIRKQLPHAA